MANKQYTYLTSKLCQFNNTYGELSLFTDSERLYLRTNAGKRNSQVILPIELKDTLIVLINSLRPAYYILRDDESLKQLMEIYHRYEYEVANSVQDEDKELVKMMFFSPLFYTASPERKPKSVIYSLWYRDGGEPDSPIVILEDGENDEAYVNRKALILKRGINRPLMVSVLNEQNGDMEAIYQITSCMFFPLDKNGHPQKGQYLNADGMTFTKDIDTKFNIKPESMHGAYKETVRRKIAKAIKLKRMGLDMTQAQLAEKAGVTRQSIASIESGDYNASIDMLSAVMAVLGIRIEIE